MTSNTQYLLSATGQGNDTLRKLQIEYYLLTVAYTVSPVFIFFGTHFVLVPTFLFYTVLGQMHRVVALFCINCIIACCSWLLDIRREIKAL